MTEYKDRSIRALQEYVFEGKNQKNKTLLDQLLRIRAEFENFRKRTDRDKENFIKFSEESLIKKVLPVMDNLDRAINSAHNYKDFDAFKKGVTMIQKQFRETLNQIGLSVINAVGEKFDPLKHEIVSAETVDEGPEGMVVEELQKGYTLSGKVIRPVMVKVSKKKK